MDVIEQFTGCLSVDRLLLVLCEDKATKDNQ